MENYDHPIYLRTARAASQLSFAAFEVYDDRLEIRAINANNHVFDYGIIPLKSA